MSTDIHALLARTFHSERLVYRAPESPADDDFVVAVNADPDAAISSSIGLPKPGTRKDAQDWIEWLRTKALIGVIVCLAPAAAPPADPTDAALDRATPPPTPIGVIFLKPAYGTAYHHRQAELGIDIVAAHQGRGYGAEAIRWVLEWGFSMAQLHRVRLGVLGWNARALRVYRRVGFRLEATEREAIWCAGRWWDNLYLAMLEDEWRETWRDVKDGARAEVRDEGEGR